MFFLTPKYLKQGRLYIKEARKRLAYNIDLWPPEKVPRVIVYGDRETDASLAVRERGGGQHTLTLEELIADLGTL